MNNAVILHGTLGSPQGNWFAWLKSQLEKNGFNVWLPSLPNSQQPSLKEGSEYVNENCPFEINEKTLLVGHSSGAILALVLAQRAIVAGLVCVSVFHDNSLNWEPNSRLFDMDIDYSTVEANAPKRLFVHSDADPYVPIDQAQFVADSVNGEFAVINNQGHFNIEQSPDYKEFPALLELLQERAFL